MIDTKELRQKDSRPQVRLSAEAQASLETLKQQFPYKHMFSAGIVEIALSALAGEGVTIATATQIIIKEVQGAESMIIGQISSMVDGMKIVGTVPAPETAGKVGRPAGSAKKMDDEATQKLYCQALGGTIDGGTCLYRKYEVTPTGRAADYEVGVPLVQLRQSHIDEQYSPSRDSWQATKDQENGTA